MIDTILFENTVGEARAALMKGSEVIEVFHRRPGDHGIPGAVFRGRVRKVDRGLNAAFVDIGEQRDGFLRARDLGSARQARSARIETLVAEGQRIGVTVAAAARAGKGVRLTAGGVDAGAGTVGLAQAAPSLVAEVLEWHLSPETVVAVDGMGVDREVAAWIAEQRPGIAVEVTQGARPSSLFEERGVEAAIADALRREVAIPGGGRVVFDRTEAMHVIDIDSAGRSGKGGRGAFDLNIAAMDVVARQIRLRRLAGAIVVDAVRLQNRSDGDAVLERLRAGFAEDRMPTEVLGFSRMGLIEINRQRGGTSLADLLTADDPCGLEADPMTAGYAALRAMQRAASPQAGVHWRLICAPDVAAVLKGALASDFARVTAGLGLVFELDPQIDCARGQEEVVAR